MLISGVNFDMRHMRHKEVFRRDERLLKAGDFRGLYKKGAAFKHGSFTLIASPNDLPKTRFGLSISARNVRLATRRARLKRLLREAFRKNKKSLKSNFDILMVVKRDPGKSVTGKAVEDILLSLMGKAGLLI